MRIGRFLLFMAVVTITALLYVWQQTEIFRLAYLGQKKTSLMGDLLDRNTLLRYNIQRYSSLAYIGKRISEEANLEFPESYQLVKVAPSYQLATSPKPKQTLISRILAVNREAEARTINP
jgi:hypothetical protein